MLDIKSLEAFYWIVRLGGFNRAADKLNTTQPAISVRIRQIEERYGVSLFQRAPGMAPSLTQKGHELFQLAEKLLNLSDEIDTTLSTLTEPKGIIRMGVSESVACTWLPSLLSLLHDRYPGLSPDVMVDVSPVLKAGLLGGEIDLSILLGPQDLPRVSSESLCSFELVWAAKAGLLENCDLSALAKRPILTFARQTFPTRAIICAFEAAGYPGPRLFPNSSLTATVKMAVAGIGVCVVPRAVIADELAQGRLEILDIPISLPRLDYVAAYIEGPHSHHLASVVALAHECIGHNKYL